MDLNLNGVFLGQILPVLLTTLGTIFTYLITVLGKKAIELIDNKIKDNKFNNALKIVEQSVFDCVMALEQTVVAEALKASADGKLTQEEAKKIKATAMVTIVNKLQPEVKEALAFGYKNVEQFLDDLVERIIKTETE